MHSIESLFCNFFITKRLTPLVTCTILLVLEVLVDIALLCNREHNKYKALREHTKHENNFRNLIKNWKKKNFRGILKKHQLHHLPYTDLS